MRWFYIFALTLLAMSFHGTARADILPGDSCTGFPIGAVTRAGGPEVGGGIGYMMACTAEGWAVVHDNGVVPPGGGGGELDYPDCILNPGTECEDGSRLVYYWSDDEDFMNGEMEEGQLPTSFYLLFMSGSNDSSSITWNDGSTTHTYLGAALNRPECVGLGAVFCMVGYEYTNLLYNAGTSPSPAPYQAARACRNKGADWYLPSLMEFFILQSFMNAEPGSGLPWELPPNFLGNGSYWTSVEASMLIGGAGMPYDELAVTWINPPPDEADAFSSVGTLAKNSTAPLRCMRRHDIPPEKIGEVMTIISGGAI